MRKLLWLILLSVFSCVSSAVSVDRSVALRDKQRETFLDLEKQLNTLPTSKLAAIHRDIEKLGNYPLVPYLKLQLAERTLESLSENTIEEFLARYAGTPLENRVRKKWLKLLANQDRQKAYIKAYQPGLGTTYQCEYLKFQLADSETPDYWLEQVNDLWLSGHSQPKECDPVFKLWKESGRMTTEMILKRAEKVARGGDRGLLGYLQRRLPASYQYLVTLWRKTSSRAAYVLNYEEFSGRYREWEKPIIYSGIIRLAWQRPEKAIKAFQHWQSEVSFSEAQMRQIHRAIAISLVIEGNDSAAEWLAKANVPDSQADVRHWHLAYTLRKEDWREALTVIDSAPDKEQQQDAFRYWRARGLGEVDALEQQDRLLTELATERHYYGFLASARLKQQPELADQPLKVSTYSIARLSTVPAVQRSHEWFLLGRYIEARREWYYLNKRLTDEEKQAATLLASDWGWHDQAIIGFAQTGYFNDVRRRFPMAFADQIRQSASQYQVDPALAMAIARRESSFMVDAVSPAGARGLMQLMPGTVNYLRKQRIGYRALLEPERNLEYGIQYLSYLNDKLNNNAVLVSASYNAGWQRVMEWLPASGDQPLDVWIENIPYKETRQYVKAVMAYRYIYQVQLGQPSNLFDTLSRMKLSADSLTLH